MFASAFCSWRERSFSQALARHGNPWFVCWVLRNSLHAGIWKNIYPRCTQTVSHNGLQTAPVAIEHLNGAGFAFGDELPLLLKALIRTNDWRGFQVPHLVAMVGLCCRFPFEYPCRSNFKNNPALLRVIVVVSEKWGNRTGDVWAVESLVVVNAWKASYPVPEFWA